MTDKPYRQMNKQERAVEDAFYGGACAVLSLIDYGGSGTASEYLAAIRFMDDGSISRRLPRLRNSTEREK